MKIEKDQNAKIEFFLSNCPKCQTLRYGRRDYLFPHLINTICHNCQLLQTFHKDDFKSKNIVELDLTQMFIHHSHQEDLGSDIEKCFFLYDEENTQINRESPYLSRFAFKCQFHEYQLLATLCCKYTVMTFPFVLLLEIDGKTHTLVYRTNEMPPNYWCYTYKNEYNVRETIMIEKPIPGNKYQWDQLNEEGE